MKIRKITYHQFNVFRTMLLSTLLPCLLAALSLALVFLPMISKSAKKNDEAYEQVLLYSAATQMDNLLTSFDDALAVVENNSWIHQMHLDLLSGEMTNYSVKKTIESELSMACIRNDFKHFSFKFYGDDTLYTNNGIFPNHSSYLQEQLQFQFYPSEQDVPVLSTISHGSMDYLLYQVPFRVVANGQFRGQINILVSSGTLGKSLSQAVGPDVAAFRITDAQGSELWAYQADEAVGETVTLTQDALSGDFRFCIDVPMTVHTQTQDSSLPVVILVMICILVISMLLCYGLSRFTYRPIEHIVQKFVGKEKKQENDFQALEQVFDGILQEKSLAEDSLADLRPLAQQKVLSALLDGTAFLGDFAEEQMGKCGVTFPHRLFNVVALEAPFSQLTESEYAARLATELLLESLNSQTSVESYLHLESTDRYRLIVNYNTWEKLQVFISGLSSQIKQYFLSKSITGSIFIGVGQAVDSPEELYHAANQADTAIYMAIFNQLEQPMFYRELAPEMNYDYYYPMSEELMLSRAITNCNSTGAKLLLDSIIEENKSNARLNPQCLQLLYMDLSSTVARSGQSLNVHTLPVNLKEQYLSLDEISDRVAAMIDHICKQIMEKRSKVISTMDREILEYIDENLFDPGLSLSSAGGAFQRSPSYISNLFREYRDTSFNNYVNRARIMRAMQLMAEQGLDSNSVFPLVGYTNLTTFRRNFSKFAKHAPGSLGRIPSQDDPL